MSILGSTQPTTPAASSIGTTPVTCTEIELIGTLIASNLVQTRPTDLPNKQNLQTTGVDFTSNSPSFEIDLPSTGAIVRNVKLSSKNVAEIEVIFVTASGLTTSPIRGSPVNFPTDNFPTEKVRNITVNIINTTDASFPQSVTLSIIVCGEDLTTTTTTGE